MTQGVQKLQELLINEVGVGGAAGGLKGKGKHSPGRRTIVCATIPNCFWVLSSQESELVITEMLSCLVEKMSVDLYVVKGKTFLIIVDQYSGLPFPKITVVTTNIF